MHLYRYSSGDHVKERRSTPKPKFTAFFMPPDNKGDYPDPIMAVTNMLDRGTEGFITRNASMLHPVGADTFVVNTLQHLRWTTITQVPPELETHMAVQKDRSPTKSQWFITEVHDNFVPDLENQISAKLADRKPWPNNGGLWYLALMAVFGVLWYFGFFGK